MHYNLLSGRYRLLGALALSSLVSLGFFVVSVLNTHSLADWYLVWNLLLAWLPLGFVYGLAKSLRRHVWLSWRPLVWTVLWLAFLPNSFYIVSDLIHLQDVVRLNVLYDGVMFESFILNGLLLGYLSVGLVHGQLLKRLRPRAAGWLIAAAFLSCSFAIYLGRDLRYNSWDLLFNPAAILFDVSEPFVDFRTHEQALTMTLTFFILLGTFYIVCRRLVQSIAHPKRL